MPHDIQPEENSTGGATDGVVHTASTVTAAATCAWCIRAAASGCSTGTGSATTGVRATASRVPASGLTLYQAALRGGFGFA